jgi:hypothetical protein
MRNQLHLSLLTWMALCISSGSQCFGALANAWHIPDNTDNLTFNMPNPEFEVGTNTTSRDEENYDDPFQARGFGTALRSSLCKG